MWYSTYLVVFNPILSFKFPPVLVGLQLIILYRSFRRGRFTCVLIVVPCAHHVTAHDTADIFGVIFEHFTQVSQGVGVQCMVLCVYKTLVYERHEPKYDTHKY